MAIVQNIPCPSCQENGHDSSGNHLIVFDDGAMFCSRKHFHKSGANLYVPSDGEDPILGCDITGEIKYTTEQFRTLELDGKLQNPLIRALALSGMRQKDSYDIMTPTERAVLEMDWNEDILHFQKLRIKHLMSRHINGRYCKLYDVRVGLGATDQIERHYYPRHNLDGELMGAKCRTLPKDFSKGTLGKVWGESQLFGESTMQAVADSGRRKDILILCGGELDALSAQEMLTEGQKGTSYEGRLHHVWSVNKGEKCLNEILARKQAILKFKKLYLCFDEDETGNALTRDVARLFRSVKGIEVMSITMPCNDPNACHMEGRALEFIDAYWAPTDPFANTHGAIMSVSQLSKQAKVIPTMGISWFLDGMNRLTLGINAHRLFVLGAGTGVGKTETTKKIIFGLTDEFDQRAAVIYLEEQPQDTVRSFAGSLINKDLTQPPINDPTDRDYTKALDYTQEESDNAIDELESKDNILIVNTGGNKSIDYIIEIMEELVAMGVQYIVLDNLTAIEMPKGGNKVDSLDTAMKQLGTFKDEKPVTIFLLAHLKRPHGDRTPHEEGGTVSIGDFRGSSSITFWADVVIGIERNTVAFTDEEKCLTTYRIVKCRQRSMSVGKTVAAMKDMETGVFEETSVVATQPEGTSRVADKYTKPSAKPALPEASKDEEF